MPLNAMTGSATHPVTAGGRGWVWTLRCEPAPRVEMVLDLPPVAVSLEPELRARLGGVVRRGRVTAHLRVAGHLRDLAWQPGELEALFRQIATIQALALQSGLVLGPVSAGDVLAGRLALADQAELADADRAGLSEGLVAALAALAAQRAEGGAQAGRGLGRLLVRMGRALEAAQALEAPRDLARREALAAALRRVAGTVREADPGVLERELAALALRDDIAGEMALIAAHLREARHLLEAVAPVGLRFDMLFAEIEHEAETLTRKARYPDLVRIGLDLRGLIAQARDTVRNLE